MAELYIKENVDNYSFIPFGFSGLTTNRQGDNIDTTLVFPNNELSRQLVLQATQEKWVAKVQTMLLDPDDPTVAASFMNTLVRSQPAVGQKPKLRWA